jgi:hypothetical protein
MGYKKVEAPSASILKVASQRVLAYPVATSRHGERVGSDFTTPRVPYQLYHPLIDVLELWFTCDAAHGCYRARGV